jgi:hypothetical protein
VPGAHGPRGWQDQVMDKVLHEVDARIARNTLNRPEVLNAIHDDMHVPLQRAVKAADADPGGHVIVLAGAGGMPSPGRCPGTRSGIAGSCGTTRKGSCRCGGRVKHRAGFGFRHHGQGCADRRHAHLGLGLPDHGDAGLTAGGRTRQVDVVHG